MSEDKTIKTAIKNMNAYLAECHNDNDTITMTAKVLRSIRDNYCELLRYKVAVERMNAIKQQNNSKLDLQADYKTLYEDLKAEHIETIKAIKQAKSEAIKEFADRFAKALSEFDMSSVGLPDYDRGYKDCMTAIEDTIDNLVKEMTE